jgi:guanosine-3',5'-bis(diphosphate) 3'-pyrophosphohydrolase
MAPIFAAVAAALVMPTLVVGFTSAPMKMTQGHHHAKQQPRSHSQPPSSHRTTSVRLGATSCASETEVVGTRRRRSGSLGESPSSSATRPRGFGGRGRVRRPKPHEGVEGALASGSLVLSDLVGRLREGVPYLDEEEMLLLEHAVLIAAYVHTAGAGPEEGRSKVERAVDVCLILGQLEVELDALLAAILSGTLSSGSGSEEQEVSVEGGSLLNAQDLRVRFGKRVARLVEAHSHLMRVEAVAQRCIAERDAVCGRRLMPREEEEQLDMLRNLIISEVADWRVLTLKVAAHLQKMRTLGDVEYAREKDAIAREALDVYAPLAHRLGIHQLRSELETLAFSHLFPREYAGVMDDLREWHGVLDSMLARTRDDLTEALQSDSNFMRKVESVTLTGRTKEPYSMWRKMRRQGVQAESVFDMVALRIIVQPKRVPGEQPEMLRRREESLCQEAMQVVAKTYPLMEGRSKDYISSPKENGYQSLHATAMLPTAGPDSTLRPFEIQIRSCSMHHQAEFGVAAHWGYKSPGGAEVEKNTMSRSDCRRAVESINSGRSLVNWLQAELRKNRVFVFVNGLIWDLEKSATASDVLRQLSIAHFYSNRIGYKMAVSCAAVNGVPVPMDYQLKNGDTISVPM